MDQEEIIETPETRAENYFSLYVIAQLGFSVIITGLSCGHIFSMFSLEDVFSVYFFEISIMVLLVITTFISFFIPGRCSDGSKFTNVKTSKKTYKAFSVVWVIFLTIYIVQLVNIIQNYNSIDLSKEPESEYEVEVTMFLLAGYIICCGEEAIPSDVNCSAENPIFPCVSKETYDVFDQQKDRIGIQDSNTCVYTGFDEDGIKSYSYSYIEVDRYAATLRRCDNNDVLAFTEKFLIDFLKMKFFFDVPPLLLTLVCMIIVRMMHKLFLKKYRTLENDNKYQDNNIVEARIEL